MQRWPRWDGERPLLPSPAVSDVSSSAAQKTGSAKDGGTQEQGEPERADDAGVPAAGPPAAPEQGAHRSGFGRAPRRPGRLSTSSSFVRLPIGGGGRYRSLVNEP